MTKTLKTAALVFGAVLAWNGRAFAVCSGGMDGADSTFSGCSELGGLGNLVYERDAAGNVTRKRSEAEIKNYLVETIEKRMERRGVKMKNADGKPEIKINQSQAVFSVFNQNGDKIYTYTVDLEEGVPYNEKDIISSRVSYDAKKANETAQNLERIKAVERLGDRIKAEENAQKAAKKSKTAKKK